MKVNHTDCIITFQKANGDIIVRSRMGICGLKSLQIGDETSMGWKVIDIHYQLYDGNESFKVKIAKFIIAKVRKWL